MSQSPADSTAPAWETDLAYWALPEAEKERLAAKRARAAALAGGALVVLFSGSEEPGIAMGRFEPRAWFRELAELTDPGCALLFDGAAWRLYLTEPDRRSQTWEGYRLGSARAFEALGVEARPLSSFEADLASRLADGASLAMEPDDLGPQARAVRDLFEKASSSRARRPGPRALHDAGALLEPLRMAVDEAEANRLRASCKIAALGHVAAWEALFRASARLVEIDGACRAQGSGSAGAAPQASPSWEMPESEGMGHLARAMIASGMRAPLTERLLEGAFLAVCAASLADGPAYAPIVAAGENALCLHWRDNRRMVRPGDWVLMDMGCSFGGFCSDLTRAVPADGDFSGLRGAAYRALLRAQLKGIDACREGADFLAADRAARAALIEDLEPLGLLRREWAPADSPDDAWRERALSKIFPHSTSHFIGRRVHDVGATKAADGSPAVLRAGMRLTVEPGLYFFPDLPGLPEEVDSVGMRIEDTCLVRPGGAPAEVLTELCPKTPEDIARIAADCGLSPKLA